MTVRVPMTGLAEGDAELDRETARYVTRVRRLATGAAFVAFDPEARVEADAQIGSIGPRGETVVRLGAVRPSTRVASRSVTLIQAVGKAGKLDAVVRDATELGVTAILPALSARCVAERSSDAALARLRRVAVEASRQSGRGDVPAVDRPRPLLDICAQQKAVLRLVMDPASSRSLRDVVEPEPADASVAFVVGPEGGLEDEEIERMSGLGFTSVRLGATTLRTETAAAATLGALLVLGRPM